LLFYASNYNVKEPFLRLCLDLNDHSAVPNHQIGDIEKPTVSE